MRADPGHGRAASVAMNRPDRDPRRAARRTALILALVASGVYFAFILSGVIGR